MADRAGHVTNAGAAGGSADANSAARAWVEQNALPVVLAVALALGLGLLAGGAFTLPGFRAVPAWLWALGFCAAGLLLGFIFAIPRVPPTVARAEGAAAAAGSAGGDKAPAGGAADSAPRPPEAAPTEINSNLVEVSDWLTKIIVGVGLVELKDLPANAESLARFVALSLGMVDPAGQALAGGVSLAGALMLYFSVLGFLGGYLLTRVYLAAIFKFVETLIYPPSPNVRLASGRELPVEELTRLQQVALEDVQRTVARMAKQIPAEEEAGDLRRAPAQRVLWVDDNPENNALLVDQLERMGVSVDAVKSTDDAKRRFDGGARYAAVVSDMGRTEGGRRVDDAGVVLVRELKARFPALPVFVYCSPQALTTFGDAARAAGVDHITSSGTRLLSELRAVLAPP
ncbi:MAG: response regulator [Burkholderiales bacterium]|nr:response regulator [Burkholderiales bacterium]